jgi:hypothetical protein
MRVTSTLVVVPAPRSHGRTDERAKEDENDD